MVYATLYLPLKPRELDELEILLRKAVSEAGLPPQAYTRKIETLDVYNTKRELIEAHFIDQLEWLTLTSACIHVLHRLGVSST